MCGHAEKRASQQPESDKIGRFQRPWPAARISPRRTRGSSAQPLILLDDAAAAGGLQIAAHGRGRLRGGEGADQGAVEGAFVAEIGAMDDRLPTAELAG